MKIAHVLTRFSPEKHPGGVETVVEELVKRQAEENEVEIICRNQFEDPSREEFKGAEIKRAECVDKDFIRTFSAIYSMRELIKNSNAEVFHIHDWSPFINYYLAGSPNRSVLTIHNTSGGLQKKPKSFCLRRADKITAVSEWLTKQIKSEYGVNALTVNNGVDVSRFDSKESEGYALFVGKLIESKGLRELCKVFEDKERKLKVVGSGPLERELGKKFEIVDFKGRVSDETLIELYNHAEYMVLPSRHEGFGLVWLEAMASGKPVLATETGLGAEIPNYCGEVINPQYTLEDLRIGLRELEGRQYKSNEIQNFAKKHHWDNITKEYNALYSEL